MIEIKKFLEFHSLDGWRWYASLGFALFKFLCVCGQSKFAIDVSDNFLLFSYAASTYFIPVLGLCKLYSWMKHNKKIQIMLHTMDERFWDTSITNKKLSSGLNHRVGLISKTVASHIFVSVGLCLVVVIFPLVQYPDGRKSLPSAIWFPYNTDISPLYEILYVSLGISNHISVLVNLNYDSLYVYFMQNVSLQFVLLKHLIRNMTDVPEVVGPIRYYSEKYQETIKNRLKTCINHHNLLMRFLDDIQEIYSFCLGVQLVLSILALVFTGYILATDHTDIIKILKILCYAAALTIQVLLYALNGTEIEKQYESLGITASQCDWYYGNKIFRYGILLIMLRSQKTFSINALGLARINNSCIVMIYKTVFSVLTLIQHVME